MAQKRLLCHLRDPKLRLFTDRSPQCRRSTTSISQSLQTTSTAYPSQKNANRSNCKSTPPRFQTWYPAWNANYGLSVNSAMPWGLAMTSASGKTTLSKLHPLPDTGNQLHVSVYFEKLWPPQVFLVRSETRRAESASRGSCLVFYLEWKY